MPPGEYFTTYCEVMQYPRNGPPAWYTRRMTQLSGKRIALILAVGLCATLTWAATHTWLLREGRFSDLSVMLWPALALTLLASVTALAWALLDAKLDRLAALLLSWATFIIFWQPNIWYVSALPIFGLFWWEAARRIRADLIDRRRLRVYAILGSGMKFILFGVFLMVSVGFYLLPSSQQSGVASVSEGIQSSLDNAYEAPLVEQQLAELPSAVRSQFKRELAASIDKTVRAYLGPFASFIPPMLAFGLFLVLWSLSFVFRELALGLGMLLFWALRTSGFVRIKEQDIKAEVLSLE